MTVHTHIYGAPSYLERHGTPTTFEDLVDIPADRLRRDHPGTATLNWVLTAGREEEDVGSTRTPNLTVNNVFGMLRAAESGLGLASLPDYLVAASRTLQRVLDHLEGPTFTAYFVYPEELKTSKRVSVFAISCSRKWPNSQSGEPNGARKGQHDERVHAPYAKTQGVTARH